MENEQFDIIEKWLGTRAYQDLTKEEKKLVDQEIGGEEAYSKLQELRRQDHAAR